MANRYKNVKVDLTTTDATTLYTVTLTNAAGAVFSLFKQKDVAAKTTTELLTQPLIVDESEIIKVQAENANDLHVVLSFLEISRD
jgi:hypothetical protein